MPRIGVAMSGGGYRAAAWGLGVLRCLDDVGLGADVTTVSSVSGGSLTNAYEGLCGGADPAQREAFAARLAGRPRAFLAALVASLLLAVALTVAACRGSVLCVAIAVVALIGAGAVGAVMCGDLLFNRWETWLYVDGLLAFPALFVWAWPRWYCVVATVLVLAAYAQLRGPVAGWSMGRSLQRLSGASGATLGDLPANPERVILATELHAGHHACFGRDFVACYDFGIGAKPSLPLRTAVQASANLPGAFPTRWLSTRGMAFAGGHHADGRVLALTDGGVYDNMADQWLVDYGERLARWEGPEFEPYRPVITRLAAARPDFLLVANASGALGWRKVWKALVPVIGEAIGLFQVKDVLYDNGASVRRRFLIQRFDSAPPGGTLVHIATNPYSFASRSPAAVAWLNDLGITREQWDVVMDRAKAVGTQLWPLGRADTRMLQHAAYVQAAVNLHVRLGVTLPAVPAFP